MITEMVFGYMMIGFALVLGALLIYYFGFRIRQTTTQVGVASWQGSKDEASNAIRDKHSGSSVLINDAEALHGTPR